MNNYKFVNYFKNLFFVFQYFVFFFLSFFFFNSAKANISRSREIEVIMSALPVDRAVVIVQVEPPASPSRSQLEPNRQRTILVLPLLTTAVLGAHVLPNNTTGNKLTVRLSGGNCCSYGRQLHHHEILLSLVDPAITKRL